MLRLVIAISCSWLSWAVGHRVRRSLLQPPNLKPRTQPDRPPIRGFDQDLWAERFRYNEASTETALAQLRGLRAANLELWRRLTPADLAREMIHNERGPESLGHLLKLMAAHDLVHRRQIDRVLGAA